MSDASDQGPHILHKRDDRVDGVVHTLTVSNPRKLNVLTSSLMDELREDIVKIGRQRDARVVVLRGVGPEAWIGGTDSTELASLDPESAVPFIRRLNDLCVAIREVPIPVLAVIRGYCLGPGLEIAVSCDFRIAADDASFGMTEIYAGMPAVAGAAFLPRMIGVGRARELLLTGRIFDTRTAYRWGMVEAMAPPGPALDALVETRVSDILMANPRAVRLQKRLCKIWEERPLREGLEIGMKAFARAFEIRDAKKAVPEADAEREAPTEPGASSSADVPQLLDPSELDDY